MTRRSAKDTSLATLPADEVRFISSEAYYHFLQGQLAADAGQCERAIEHYREALSFDPDSAHLHVLCGRCLLRLGRLDDSLREARRAVALDPSGADASLLLARGLMLARDLPQAAQVLKRAAEAHPETTSLVELQAEIALDRGQDEYALQLMQRLATHDPSDPRPTLALGLLLLRQTRWELAAQALEQTLQRDPDSLDAMDALTRAYEHLDRREDAARVAARRLDLTPDDRDAIYSFMRLQARTGQLGPAQVLMQRWHDEEGSAELWVAAAQGLADGGADASAVTVLDEILAREPDLDLALFTAGSLHARHGRLKRADTLLRRLEPGSPLFSEAQVERSRVLWRMGRLRESREVLEQARTSVPDSLEISLALADVLARQQQYERAFAILEELPVPALGRELVVAARSQLLAEMGRADESVQVVSDLVALRPDDADLLVLLAIAYERAGRKAESEGAARQALTAMPDHVAAQNFLAYTLAQHGDRLDEAVELARRAVSTSPDDGYIVDTLGFVLLQQGSVAEARQVLLRANELSPDEPEILLHLGDTERALGQHHSALKRYRRALQLSPRERSVREAVQERLTRGGSR
ncbi:MAG: tetratricopeptide repeat protein [Pseudomonadota bacterium]